MVHLFYCFVRFPIAIANIDNEINKANRLQIGKLSFDNMLDLQDVLTDLFDLDSIRWWLVIGVINMIVLRW